MVALRDGDSVHGFPRLEACCRELVDAAPTSMEENIWKAAATLCSDLAANTKLRSRDRLFLFRDLNRLLGPDQTEPDVLDKLEKRLAAAITIEGESGSAKPPAGFREVFNTLSSHSVWDDTSCSETGEPSVTESGPGPQTTVSDAPNEFLDEGEHEELAEPAFGPAPDVPLSYLVPRFARVLRFGCQVLQRSCDLEVQGDPIFNQNLLKSLIEPIEIIIRNLLFYGVVSDAPNAAKMTIRMVEQTEHRQLVIETDTVGPDLARMAVGVLSRRSSNETESGLDLLFHDEYSSAHHSSRLQGYGYGLADARRMVRDLGGSLRIELPAEAGLRFLIELP